MPYYKHTQTREKTIEILRGDLSDKKNAFALRVRDCDSLRKMPHFHLIRKELVVNRGEASPDKPDDDWFVCNPVVNDTVSTNLPFAVAVAAAYHAGDCVYLGHKDKSYFLRFDHTKSRWGGYVMDHGRLVGDDEILNNWPSFTTTSDWNIYNDTHFQHVTAGSDTELTLVQAHAALADHKAHMCWRKSSPQVRVGYDHDRDVLLELPAMTYYRPSQNDALANDWMLTHEVEKRNLSLRRVLYGHLSLSQAMAIVITLGEPVRVVYDAGAEDIDIGFTSDPASHHPALSELGKVSARMAIHEAWKIVQTIEGETE